MLPLGENDDERDSLSTRFDAIENKFHENYSSLDVAGWN